ncbi:hypothetical protein PGC35_08455 [Psychrobacillus sp. PGGUH221]
MTFIVWIVFAVAAGAIFEATISKKKLREKIQRFRGRGGTP